MGPWTYVAIGAAVGGTILLAPVALSLAGFTTAGVAAGSMAAAVQSGIGNVVAGSMFAMLQSLGAAGMTAGTVATAGAAAGAAGAGAAVADNLI